ncbi:hypothetical protein F5H01DRAFT_347792 [Linnemannia elongata]|nr:hypothetical protein F5H01DRAFT_347792 [Linnemannia elongata]
MNSLSSYLLLRIFFLWWIHRSSSRTGAIGMCVCRRDGRKKSEGEASNTRHKTQDTHTHTHTQTYTYTHLYTVHMYLASTRATKINALILVVCLFHSCSIAPFFYSLASRCGSGLLFVHLISSPLLQSSSFSLFQGAIDVTSGGSISYHGVSTIIVAFGFLLVFFFLRSTHGMLPFFVSDPLPSIPKHSRTHPS